MTKQIFVNLAVEDLDRSIKFFSKLGFEFNKDFTNEKGACMIVNEGAYVMLLTKEFFSTFTGKQISDAKKTTEVLTAISLEGRKKVDELAEQAVQAGGREARDPQDHGFMYQRTVEDPDGHMWELFYYEESAKKP